MKTKKVGDYLILFEQPLGSGTYGTVYKSFNLKGQKFAVKLIPVKQSCEKIRQNIERQKQILLSLNGENVVCLYDYILTDNYHYFFMELCQSNLCKVRSQAVPQQKGKRYLTQIINGYRYLYNMNIIHRDLKPQNILINGEKLKITDFGVSKICLGDEENTLDLGSPSYMAPQIYYKNYSYKVDIWSIGTIYYQILHQKKPFKCNAHQLKTQRPLIIFNPSISAESRDFIQKCLEVDPKKRISLQQILTHPIFEGHFLNKDLMHAQKIMMGVKRSIENSEIIREKVLKLLQKQRLISKQLSQQQFWMLMSQISEFMDKTKSKVVFDFYKTSENKILLPTINKVLGNLLDKKQANQQTQKIETKLNTL